MGIVHIILGKANPNRMNGVNKVVFQLASHQASAGKDVQVWGIAEDTIHNYGERNFETRLFKKSKNPFGISRELKSAIEESKVEVFHLHGGWIPMYWVVSKYLKKYGKHMVLTPHGAYNSIAMQKNAWIKKRYFTLFEKFTLNRVNKIHCIGKSEKEGLESIYPNDKQRLVPYGFEGLRGNLTNKDNGEDFIVGFVGRIDIHTKGLDLLTEAFARFKKGKNTKLWIVGNSNELLLLKRRVLELGISKDTILFGSQYGEDKNKLLQQMNIFTHPSRNEGLPTAVLEAASFGVPSVVTEATNVGKYITKYNAGLCIANENVNALEEALDLLYHKWENKQMGIYAQNTKSMLEKEFNWDSLVSQFDELYQ
ncbi:MAG: hypothetical protein COA58_10745 [Bacteroidetes bacterium]|nr:MAG: hypothetical protein COA58_10745 [Bacteroidota bacterium]